MVWKKERGCFGKGLSGLSTSRVCRDRGGIPQTYGRRAFGGPLEEGWEHFQGG